MADSNSKTPPSGNSQTPTAPKRSSPEHASPEHTTSASPTSFSRPLRNTGPSSGVVQNGTTAGINAAQISSAKELFTISTRSRYNPAVIQGSKTRVVPRSTPFPASMPTTGAAPSVPQGVPPSVLAPAPAPSPNISIPAKSHEGVCKNPQCAHCGSVIIPAPASSYPIRDSPSISVNSWEVFTTRKPILNAEEIDYYEEKLHLPLPEMIFGKNEIRIKNTKYDWEIVFNSIDALDTVLKIGCDPNKLLKVAHSNHWFSHRQSKSRTNVFVASANNENEISLSSDMYNTEVPTENINEYVTKMIKPYDWTYTPSYRGTLRASSKHQFVKTTANEIPVRKLKRPDPILFFDDVVLYEDELADNGIAILQSKIRVMEKRLLLLSRFFLRIDDVIFKIKDVRVFVEFEDNVVIRDVKEQEDTYQNVYNKVLRLGKGGDPRVHLRDSNWVSCHLPTTFHEVEEVVFEKQEEETKS